MKAFVLLSCLLCSCVESLPDPPIDNGWCSFSVNRQRFASEVHLSATCPEGETRSLLLAVKDGETMLSSSLVRFACGSVRLVSAVAASNPDLDVTARILRDDRSEVVCSETH